MAVGGGGSENSHGLRPAEAADEPSSPDAGKSNPSPPGQSLYRPTQRPRHNIAASSRLLPLRRDRHSPHQPPALADPPLRTNRPTPTASDSSPHSSHFASPDTFPSSAADPGHSHREGAGSDARSGLKPRQQAKWLRTLSSQPCSQPGPQTGGCGWRRWSEGPNRRDQLHQAPTPPHPRARDVGAERSQNRSERKGGRGGALARLRGR
jgi:hypothetical protein